MPSSLVVTVVLAACSCASNEQAPRGEPPSPRESAPTTSIAVAAAPVPIASPSTSLPGTPRATREQIAATFGRKRPHHWGQALPGVRTTLSTSERAVALTLDACGGPGGNGYDERLIQFLRRQRVAATLFLSRKWIDANLNVARELAVEPLFQIESHGTHHRPCSVSGRAAYGIRGTRSAVDAFDEIAGGADRITDLTGKAPRFHRPGTAFFDDVCVDVIGAMGMEPAGFSVNGDGGSGASRRQVRDALTNAPAGAIILIHMNHPAGSTAEGVSDAVPTMAAHGVKFVRLSDMQVQ